MIPVNVPLPTRKHPTLSFFKNSKFILKMKFKIFFISIFALAFSTASFAQCGSSKSHKTSWKTQKASGHSQDIVDIAASDDNFSTLVVAVKTAGLVETLKGDGPFTVFAPTNTAFAKLPAGTVESLLKPESKKALSKILTYHVVSGEFNAKDIIAAINSSGGSYTVETVSGDRLTATLTNGTVLLTDENGGISAVTQTDLNTSNGVIHVIDSVVLPN